MKKFLKILFGIVVVFYIIVAIFTTTFLLKRNDYSVTEFGDNSLLIVNEEELEPYYSNGTLLVIKKADNDSINVGDNIFFYDTYSTEKIVKYNEVTKKEKVTDTETTYTTKDNSVLSSQYVIGSEDTTSEYGFVGKVLNVLQSRWGFLFIIVFPLFLTFIYEIYAIVKEVKKS